MLYTYTVATPPPFSQKKNKNKNAYNEYFLFNV